MKYRKLGSRGLETSALGLGCSPLSGTPLGSYGKVPEDVVEAIFDRAVLRCYRWNSSILVGKRRCLPIG